MLAVQGKELFATIDAALNAASTTLLVAGYAMIRLRHVRAHVTLMIAALGTSAAFLVCYVYSKAVYGETSSGLQSGPVRSSISSCWLHTCCWRLECSRRS
jgi:uncharacterized membrane protein YozB (DUF420 family)